jgi:hypothetical protein
MSSPTDEYVISVSKDEWIILSNSPLVKAASTQGVFDVCYEDGTFLFVPSTNKNVLKKFIATAASYQGGRPAEMRFISAIKAIYSDLYA